MAMVLPADHSQMLHDTVTRIQTDVDSLTQRVNKIESSMPIQTLDPNEYQMQRKELEESKKELKSLKIQLQDVQEQLRIREQEIQDLQQERGKDKEEIQELRETVAQLQKTVEEKENIIKRLELKMKTLGEELKNTQEEMKTLARIQRRMTDQVSALQNEFGTLRSQVLHRPETHPDSCSEDIPVSQPEEPLQQPRPSQPQPQQQQQQQRPRQGTQSTMSRQTQILQDATGQPVTSPQPRSSRVNSSSFLTGSPSQATGKSYPPGKHK